MHTCLTSVPACLSTVAKLLVNVVQDEYKTEPGTVIAADFYHSNTLMPLSDAEIVSKVKHNLDQCEPGFQSAQVRGKICLQTECHCPEALLAVHVGK